jgi:hypothetical protein
MSGESGLETIVMVARRTPLPPDVSLGKLIGQVPVVPMRKPGEFAVLRDLGASDPSRALERSGGRDIEEEAAEIDHPVVQVMARLREHFEVVRAVRFAHQK